MTHVRFGRSHLHPMDQLTNTWITRTQSFSFLWQWTLQDACMTTSFGSCSCMFIVKHRLWLMTLSCLRNRISFVSLEIRVSLMWRMLLVWLWRKHQVCGFNPPGPLISVFHTASSFHTFTSSHSTYISFPSTFSSVFCLSGTDWMFILPFHWFLFSS